MLSILFAIQSQLHYGGNPGRDGYGRGREWAKKFFKTLRR